MEAVHRIKPILCKPQNQVIFMITIAALLVAARLDYLLFHTVVEGMLAIVAIFIFIIVSDTYK